MSEASGSRERFTDIQWLRGIAALLVVFEHLKNEMYFRLQGLDPTQSALAVFPFSAGVDIFFVISGFVIAHSSSGLFGRRRAWSVFLYRRLARIVPLYWLLTLLAALGTLLVESRLAGGFDPFFVFGSFFFLPVENVDGVLLPILPLGWTLNYEMMFYAVFAAALWLPQRRALAIVCLTLFSIVLAGWLLRPALPMLSFWSQPIILEFLAGIGIQRLWARGLRLSTPARLLLASLGFALLFLVGTPENLPAWRWLVWGGPAAMIVLAAASGGGSTKSLPAEIAGDTSYALYLLHLLVLLAVSRVFLTLGLTGPAEVYVLYPLVALSLTAIGTFVLHYGVEAPLLRFLRRRIDRATAEGPGAVPGP